MAFSLSFAFNDSFSTAAARCVYFGAGIVVSLVVYGLLQERIMTVPYGDTSELFADSIFLVFCKGLAAILFAVGMVAKQGESFQHKAPLWKYLALSVSCVLAGTYQFEVLKYVSFPVFMLCKSFKMMPAMLWGKAVGGKSFGLQDWIVALVVTGAAAQFLVTGPNSSAEDSFDTGFGQLRVSQLLLVAYLALDGFTWWFQGKLFEEDFTSKYNQMLYINLGSALMSFAAMLLSGNLVKCLDFAAEHPGFLMDAGAISTVAVAGQWFCYSQALAFGTLVFEATVNVRQVFSILMSYYVYGHVITTMQVNALALIFGALFYKSFVGFVAPLKEVSADTVADDVKGSVELKGAAEV